ncbi:MAG: enoyl-CoA hydratase-related protein [Desulfobacterales bacterium]|jgi:2-(1,2-epoxy-1,2-dihydrophenyl)acetyl-CoA isomerase
MSEKTVLLHKNNNIATLVLNRPEIMNALNPELIQALQDALDQIEGDKDVRVVVLKGSGENFCSGADMNILAEAHSSDQLLQAMRHVGSVIRRLRGIPQPIITALRGVAVGGGANLALAGDFVITAEDARFCEIFIHLGLILDMGGTYFLPRLVGLIKARELAFLGEEIDGKTAAAIGLVYKSVPAEELDNEAAVLAGKLAQRSLAALALIKEGLEGSFDKNLKEILDWEAAHQAVMLQTSAHKEIVKLFFESRKKD